jgi:hypothetical protein
LLAPSRQPANGADDASPAVHGVVVTFTSISTGDMKILAAYDKQTTVRPLRVGPRSYHHEVLVAGVVADKERCYVLKRTSKWAVGQGTPAFEANMTTSYQLLVFRCSDGSLIHTQGLPAPTRPAMETAEPGPLQLIDNGVQCFGFKTQFKGAELIKPETRQPQANQGETGHPR